MNSMIVTSVKGEPKSSPTRDEFRRIGGVGAIRLAGRPERALFSAQIRRESGNEEMAKDLACLAVREYLKGGQFLEAKLVAKAFGLPKEVVESEAELAIAILTNEKKEVPVDNASALVSLFAEFGPRGSNLDALAELFARRFSKITSADRLFDSISKHVEKINEFQNLSDTEREKYFLALAAKLAMDGNALGVGHLLSKAGLLQKDQEVVESAVRQLKEAGDHSNAYFRFALFAKEGFIRDAGEEFFERFSALFYDSVLADIKRGKYQYAIWVIKDATRYNLPYALVSELDLLAATFLSIKERILNVSLD